MPRNTSVSLSVSVARRAFQRRHCLLPWKYPTYQSYVLSPICCGILSNALILLERGTWYSWQKALGTAIHSRVFVVGQITLKSGWTMRDGVKTKQLSVNNVSVACTSCCLVDRCSVESWNYDRTLRFRRRRRWSTRRWPSGAVLSIGSFCCALVALNCAAGIGARKPTELLQPSDIKSDISSKSKQASSSSWCRWEVAMTCGSEKIREKIDRISDTRTTHKMQLLYIE